MSFKHRHTRTWSSPTGQSIQNTIEVENEGEVNIDLLLASGSTDVEVPCAFDSSRIKAFYVLSTEDITIDPGSPNTPILPKANKAISWVTGDTGTAPFSADVTSLLLSNDSGNDDATVKIRILHDTTA